MCSCQVSKFALSSRGGEDIILVRIPFASVLASVNPVLTNVKPTWWHCCVEGFHFKGKSPKTVTFE